MKVKYDHKADILYIKIRDDKIVETRMFNEDTYADIGEDQNVVGIEIWKASTNLIQPLSRDIAEEAKSTLQKCA